MNEIQFTYEGAIFDIEYEVNRLDEPTETWVNIWSIKHQGVEFLDILSDSLLAWMEEQLSTKLLGD
jgi:hypothetical protein